MWHTCVCKKIEEKHFTTLACINTRVRENAPVLFLLKRKKKIIETLSEPTLQDICTHTETIAN